MKRLAFLVLMVACSSGQSPPTPTADSGTLDSLAIDRGGLDSLAVDSGAAESRSIDRPPTDSGVAESRSIDGPPADWGAAESGSIDRSPADSVGVVIDPSLMCVSGVEARGHMTGRSADGQVSFILDRCTAGGCGGGCQIGQVYFALTYHGRTDAAKGADVTYMKTHHNFLDSLVAGLPDRVLKWRTTYAFPPPARYFVSVETRQGVPILPQTEVIAGVCTGIACPP